MKRSKTKAAHFRTPIEKLGKKATIEHYNAVLFEDIKSQMKHVIDVSENTKIELRREIGEFRTEVNDRFNVLEVVVRGHSVDIKGLKMDMSELKVDMAGLKTDVAGLKTDVTGLKTDVTGLKEDVQEIRTEMHEMEDRLSNKIDKIALRVDNHEERITSLESVGH